jgi:hypothetical protein
VDIIRTKREHFNKVSKAKSLEEILKYIRGEEYLVPEGDFELDLKYSFAELKKLSAYYDFFKSQIVSETLMRLFLVWKRNNHELGQHLGALNILAGVIYSLYPSILHFPIDPNEIKKEVNPKSLFYFLNSEEHFDSDVYIIFDHLMSETELKKLNGFYPRFTSDSDLKNFIENKEVDSNITCKMNRLERISLVLMKISNFDLVSYFNLINFDTYDLVYKLFSSLLTSSICFSDLTYLWDNIFLNSEVESLDFLDYVIPSLFNNISSQLVNTNIETLTSLIIKYPENYFN